MSNSVLGHNIECQWYMHYKCNYRCPYCYFLKNNQELIKKDVYLSVQECVRLWDKIYDRYGSAQIQLTGGEPCIYPSFIELVKQLSRKHTFKICTNLSGDFVSFSEQIDPGRITGGIGASFHPTHVDFDFFLNKVRLLRNRGFLVYITYVAYPPQLKQMPYYIKRFKDELGKDDPLKFVILPYRGDYQGISYPDWYPDEQRKLIWEVAEQLGDDGTLSDLEFQMAKQYPKIKSNGEEKEIPNLGRASPKGRLCRAGQKYIVIDSDGSVTRCGEKGSKHLGYFFEQDFRLLEVPLPCENSQCNCEFKWLVEPDEAEESSVLAKRSAAVVSRVTPEQLPPPHKVYFNWDIHYSCNYRCAYCFLEGKWEEIARGNVYPGIEKWIGIWQRIYEKYGTCQIDISGGEPSIYPSFFRLVRQMAKLHDLKITTNLSFDVLKFVQDMLIAVKQRGPGAVAIHSSFKPDRVAFRDFFDKVIFLQQSGFSINVTYVAYPPHLERMAKTKNIFEENNIEFVIQPFRGAYQDRSYPQGYTEEEKKIFQDCYNGNPPPLISYFVQDKIKKEEKLCRMGQVYAKVHPNGETYRCCAQGADRLGNLIQDKDFSLLTEPAYCKLPCPCWKAMIVDKEQEWLPHWQEK